MNFNYHVIGFLDILGFSAMVESDSRSAVPRFLPVFVEVFAELSKFNTEDGPKVRMFSDSILVEASLSPVNIIRVFEVAGELQRLFLRKGILVRGGIAYGKHFSSENVTFSQALVDAYHIESKEARFPRVVIDRDTLSYAWHHDEVTEEMKEKIRGIVKTDRDGANFIDYLNVANLKELTGYIESCLRVKPRASENVLEKMRWLLDYHNHCAVDSSEQVADARHLRSGFTRFENIA